MCSFSLLRCIDNISFHPSRGLVFLLHSALWNKQIIGSKLKIFAAAVTTGKMVDAKKKIWAGRPHKNSHRCTREIGGSGGAARMIT